MTQERVTKGKLPWSHELDVHDVNGRIKAMGAKTAIDIGCGMIHTPISGRLRDYEFDRFVAADFYDLYIKKLEAERNKFKAKEVEFLCLDAFHVPAHFYHKKQFDVALLLDIVEHLSAPGADRPSDLKRAAIDWISSVEKLAFNVLIWIPIGYCPIDKDPWGTGNHKGHKHHTTWHEDDLENMGYSYELFPGFHDPHVMRYWTAKKQWHCHGAWAYKRTE